MNFFILILLILNFFLFRDAALGSTEQFKLSPLCTKNGNIICPEDYIAACADEKPGDTVPRCLLLNDKYIPGCWKFTGHKSIDFSLIPVNLPASAMVKITGDGDIFTLDRDIIGCRKL